MNSEQKKSFEDVHVVTREVEKEQPVIQKLRDSLGQVIIGQKYMIERLFVGLLCNHHILIEGVPGLAKTLAITTFARALGVQFQRIQFTPDLLPADLVGTLMYNPKTGEFNPKKGPLFAHIVLADEINRAPAKVQSALLEAMQERQITLGDTSYPLGALFMVLATQNPIEQGGTYPLPEAQMDRFMLKLKITYPDKGEELNILRRMAKTQADTTIQPVISPEDVFRLRRLVDRIYIDPKIEEYIVTLIDATRHPDRYGLDLSHYIRYGASPRATIYLTLAAKAFALLQGRGYTSPQDVKSIGMDVLRHRVIITYEAEADEKSSEDLLKTLFDTIEVP